MARTQAFNDFIPVLRTAKELGKIDSREYRDPPTVDERDAVRGLRGGAAVLMVAGFEAYLDDALREMIEFTKSYSPPVSFDQLPDGLRVQNVFGALEGVLHPPPHREPGTKVSRLPVIHMTSSIVGNKDLHPDAFGGSGGNPGKEALRAILKTVGLTDIYRLLKPRFEKKWGQPVSDTFIGAKLDEIVRRRHRVAHRADALSISRQELRESIKFLRVLSETLDIELGFHFRKVCRESR
ncbi:MAG: HEPN domain-containing protein [Pyrinomonadaceae bacterium]